MPEYVLFFATLAALTSCVKENNLLPEQTTDNLVTIKAVSADTKTVLNGTDVVWENGDAIKVVFNSTEKQHVAEFTTDITGTSATATFSGELDTEITTDACGDAGYAVYPSTVNVESDGKIMFSVPATQNGLVEKDENLAYAKVSLSELRSTHTTEATFANALSLIEISVPQGVKKVTVTSADGNDDAVATPITGTAPYFYADDALSINMNKWYDTDRDYSVTLKNEDDSDLDHTKKHYVHVFPGVCEGLTITIDGTDCTYSKEIGEFTFVASEYHTINVANIFNLTSDTYLASPFGGVVEIPVVTTLDEYEVTIDAEATWLTETAVKSTFRKDVVSLTAAANTTGAERSATVTINGTAVTISQKGYVPELLGEYVETFVRQTGFATESGSFEIKKTDDPSKGVYLIEGILGGQNVYADYVTGTLTCYDNGYERIFTVSAEYQISASNGVQIGTTVTIYPSSYGGKYMAVKKQGAPTLTSEEEALVGMYNEVWKYQKSSDSEIENVSAANGMTIAASDEAAFGRLKVTFLSKGGSFACYANLDGSDLKILLNGATHATYGTAQQDITMSVSGETLSFSSLAVAVNNNYGTISDYSATKVEISGDPVTVENLIGTAWEQTLTVNMCGMDVPQTGTMTIIATDNTAYGALKVEMFPYVPNNGTYYADLSAEGDKLTVYSANSVHPTYGPLTNDIVLNITSNKITWDGSITFSVGYDTYVWKSFVATKQ